MKKLLVGISSLLISVNVSAKTYELQSAFGKNMPILGSAADRFSDKVAELTNDEIQFKHLGDGELSPAFEILDNVGAGAITAGWSYAGYTAGKAPAADLFGSIPFGPEPIKYLSWIHHGGGLELWQEIYEPFNVVPMPCGTIISEAAGWFTREITTPDDLKGLKFRIGGLGGEILAKLGAEPQSIPAGEIATSLETGRLDGTELSFPTIDALLGLEKSAKHYYFPGWHQPSGFIEFYMNKDVWDGLSEQNKTAIETACMDINLWTIGNAVAAQGPVIEKFEEAGVKVERLPEPVISALQEATMEVIEEKSEQNEDFKKVIESYKTFSEAYDLYDQLSELQGRL